MWEWLFQSIDISRAHDVDLATAWHGRLMVLAWGVLAPLAVIVARYFKVMPGQDWPRELDNQLWWRSHWIGQMVVFVLSVFALVLMLPLQIAELSVHGALGCAVFVLLAVQITLGVFRGSKGGPTAPAPDGSFKGDHYEMTTRRRWFEALHKTIGYCVLTLAGVTILYGLAHANAPNWMSVVVVLWWVCLGVCCVFFQRNNMAVGSYQAIWGKDAIHPGNAVVPRRRVDGASDHHNDRVRNP